MNYYLTVLKKYAVFNGQAQRKEFWYFVLFDSLAGFLVIYIAVGRFTGNWVAPFFWYLIGPFMPPSFSVFFWIYILALTVPRIAVAVRRMHDVGKSGWYLFIVLVPIYGVIRLLILLASDSKHGENIHPKDKDDSKNDDKKSNYCTKCGKKIDPSSKFCTGCGNKN